MSEMSNPEQSGEKNMFMMAPEWKGPTEEDKYVFSEFDYEFTELMSVFERPDGTRIKVPFNGTRGDHLEQLKKDN